jgi:hypothetical protein
VNPPVDAPVVPPPPSPPIAETPQTTPPAGGAKKFGRGLKKNGKKIAVGALMFMLLAGGAWFGVSEVQKRQVATQQAAKTCTNKNCCEDYGDPKKRQACRKAFEAIEAEKLPPPSNMEYNDRGYPAECLDGDGCTYDEALNDGAGVNRIGYNCMPSGTTFNGTNGCAQEPDSNLAGYFTVKQKDDTYRYYPIIEFVPKEEDNEPPTAPRVSPSPSPTPTLACVDLTSSKTTPTLGDTVTVSCEASFTAVSPVAFFRYSSDNGVTYTSALPASGVAVDAATHRANYDVTVDKTGAWIIQCRVCADAAGANCTEWGKAQ